jgi:multisubunit Na+/H+ antiporter MnhE subunit
MTRLVVVAAGLAAVYLLVMTSLAPGDVVVAAVLGLVAAAVSRPSTAATRTGALNLRPRAVPGLIAGTAAEMVRGSWRTVRFCLGWRGDPGFVEIPRDGRTDMDVALWGLITGEAPDEIVVDVDEERDVLIVHLLDAGDPEDVRARHRADLEHRRGTAVG